MLLVNSPLLQAIRSRHSANIITLLNWEADPADPNGLDMLHLQFCQALFLRFRPELPDDLTYGNDFADRGTFLSNMELSQTAPLTQEEIGDRLYDAVAPFWSEEHFISPARVVNVNTAHSLVEAARTGSFGIFNHI